MCFIVITYAEDPDGIKRVKDMGKANACSRVIPFDSYITNPYYALGPLYYTTTATSVETISEKKIKIGSIYFNYDTFTLVDSQINARLNARRVSRVRCQAFLTGSSNFSLLFHLFANGQITFQPCFMSKPVLAFRLCFVEALIEKVDAALAFY